ncbi:hypothetical protein KCU65_g750, partial [Aureobasidium melanogenum]
MQAVIPQPSTHQRQDSGYSQGRPPQTHGLPTHPASQAASPTFATQHPYNGFMTQRPSVASPTSSMIRNSDTDVEFANLAISHIMKRFGSQFVDYESTTRSLCGKVDSIQSQVKQLEKTVTSFWKDTNAKLESTKNLAVKQSTTEVGNIKDSSKTVGAVHACEFGHTVTVQGKADVSASNQEYQIPLDPNQQPDVPTEGQESSSGMFHGSLRQRLDCVARVVSSQQVGHTATTDCFNKVSEILQSISDHPANVVTKEDLEALRMGTRRDLEVFRRTLRQDPEADRKATLQSVRNLFEELRQDLGSFRGETKQDVKTLFEEMRQNLGPLREEIKQTLESLRGETKQELGSVRAETKQDFNTIREKLDQHELATENRLKECLTNQTTTFEELRRDLRSSRAESKQDLITVREENRQDLQSLREETKQDLKTFSESHVQHMYTTEHRLKECLVHQTTTLDELRQDLGSIREESKQSLETIHGGIKQDFNTICEKHSQHELATENLLKECLANQTNTLEAFGSSEMCMKQELSSVRDTLKGLKEVVTARLPVKENQLDLGSFRGEIKTDFESMHQRHDQHVLDTENWLKECLTNQTNTLGVFRTSENRFKQELSSIRDVLEGLEEVVTARLPVKEDRPEVVEKRSPAFSFVQVIRIDHDPSDGTADASELGVHLRDQSTRTLQSIAGVAQASNDTDLEIVSSGRERVGHRAKAPEKLAVMHSNEICSKTLASLLRSYMSSTSPSLGRSQESSISPTRSRAISEEEKPAQQALGREDVRIGAKSSLGQEKRQKKHKSKHRVDLDGVFGPKQLIPKTPALVSSSGGPAHGQKAQKRKWEVSEIPQSRADLLQQQQQAYRKKQKK